jgi:hypothetical protein
MTAWRRLLIEQGLAELCAAMRRLFMDGEV